MTTRSEEMKHLTARVDLNRATEEELARIPILGPERAHNIVEYRSQHGPFHSIDDLRQVPEVGAAVVEELRAALAAEGWH